MISVETYLSFMNYEGIAARGVPTIGNILPPQVDPPLAHVVVQVAPVERLTRKPHWTGSFQVKFSRWLAGKGDRPAGIAYSRAALIQHLERQFVGSMSWKNYAGHMPYRAKRVWVVDHITPKIGFGLHDVGAAYALTNLRPLWMRANMRKGRSITHLL